MMKTRFAPSPTGYMHLGNTRTALFCALLAKAQKGTFLLRIEDTDQARSATEFAEQLELDLNWLELNWQEGPNVGGEKGPYFQSQRHAIYAHYYQQLEQQGLAYPCFCSDQELAIARKIQLSSGKPPRYAGTCRHLTEEQIAAKTAVGIKPTLRFRVPDNQFVEFVDLVKGQQRYNSNDIGDFIIRRADGSSAFFFCNAIDDALMQITHILRGEDHLTNTPRQLMILQALNLPLPQYGHISLILGQDGSPLSKRNGSRSVRELREEGYLPSALQNYLARLGHYYSSNDFMSLDQLANDFTFESLGSAPAHFDPSQLHYWQKQAVHQLDKENFWQWLGSNIQNRVPTEAKELFIETIQPNTIFPEDALALAEIFFSNELEYHSENLALLKQTDKTFFTHALNAIEVHGTDFKQINQFLQSQGFKGKNLFQPLRLALTNKLDGPEMAKIFILLGKEKIQQRIIKASKIII